MKASTPRERQISRLGWYEGRGFRVLIAFLCLVPLVVVVLGVMNLHAASRHAKLAQTTLGGAFRLWLAEPDPDAIYPGHLVLALERMEDAVLQFAEAPVAIGLLLALRGRRRSARELLELLKEHNA